MKSLFTLRKVREELVYYERQVDRLKKIDSDLLVEIEKEDSLRVRELRYRP